MSTNGYQSHLPAPLRGPATVITPMGGGFSGAGVFRVEADGQAFVLKIASESVPAADWRRRAAILQRAAAEGVAPPVVHTDVERKSIVSMLVTSRSFPAFLTDQGTHETAVDLLGRTLRRVHELPLPPGMGCARPRALLEAAFAAASTVSVPPFVTETVREVLSEEEPSGRRMVLSHNDVNPTNLAFDGENLLLLDWDAAAANDPLFDLATAAVFFRMDETICLRLLTAHDGEPVSRLPEAFSYYRRLVASLCGTNFLLFARSLGHPGATGRETLESSPSLSDVHQRMRSGSLNVLTSEGAWCFGLALVKSGFVKF